MNVDPVVVVGLIAANVAVMQYVFRFQRTTLTIARSLSVPVSKCQVMLTPTWMGTHPSD